jgi:hypothetical protein
LGDGRKVKAFHHRDHRGHGEETERKTVAQQTYELQPLPREAKVLISVVSVISVISVVNFVFLARR